MPPFVLTVRSILHIKLLDRLLVQPSLHCRCHFEHSVTDSSCVNDRDRALVCTSRPGHISSLLRSHKRSSQDDESRQARCPFACNIEVHYTRSQFNNFTASPSKKGVQFDFPREYDTPIACPPRLSWRRQDTLATSPPPVRAHHVPIPSIDPSIHQYTPHHLTLLPNISYIRFTSTTHRDQPGLHHCP